MTLAEFLAARLDEDEAAAKAATAGPWRWDEPFRSAYPGDEWTDQGPSLKSLTATSGGYPVIVVSAWGHDAWGINVGDEDAAHIARHDPARVLREVAAMRAILGRYASQPANLGDQLQRGQEQMGLLYALEQLAAIWDDHPDYEGEWRP